MEAEVKCTMSCIVQGQIHNLEIHSRSVASSKVEEVAARAILLFMESELNIKVVDLSYVDREVAEKKKEAIEYTLDSLIHVAQHIKTQMGDMVDCIAGGCAAYSADARFMFGGPVSIEQNNAVKFCLEGIESVRAKCATRYNSSVSILQSMEKLISSLQRN